MSSRRLSTICVCTCVRRFVSVFVLATVFLNSIWEVYFIFTLSGSELPLWRDPTSQLFIRCRPDERGNENKERGTKRQEGSFPLATPGMALGYLSRAEETATSNLMFYRVPKKGCAASSCKSFSPRTECAARARSTKGKESADFPDRVLIQYIQLLVVSIQSQLSDGPPTTHQSCLASETRRSQESEQTGSRKSARRNSVGARPITDPRAVWQASEGRFPTCDPPRSGSSHTRAERFLPQLLRTINRPLWESDS